MNRIGFQVDRLTEKWNEHCSKLEAYHARNGNCNVSHGSRADRALGEWVDRQRKYLKKGTLKPERVARLDALRLQADPYTDTWNESCCKLEAYYALNRDDMMSRGHT